MSPEAASDRLAIRELIDAYSHCADRRDAKGQMALSTREPHFVAQTIFIAAIRYYDTFAKSDGAWLFAERKLYVDWTDIRPLGSPAA